MTIQDKTTLKGYFNTGDVPSEANFTDLIDSFVILDWSNNINLNTNGQDILFSSYQGINSDGENIWIGGGGQSAIGEVGTTAKGAYNTALGYYALFSNTTGYNNIAVGAQCLILNTTGRMNTAVGSFSLYNNLTGFYNTAIGQSSQQNLTDGYYNTSLGMDTLHSNTTGHKNIAVGEKALYDLNIIADDGSGNNIAVGYNTGRGIITGINNVILGSNITGLGAALNNNIIIGDGGGTIRIQIDDAGGIVFSTPKMGFFGHVAAAQPTKAGHGNWAALANVVQALVDIGIFDAA